MLEGGFSSRMPHIHGAPPRSSLVRSTADPLWPGEGSAAQPYKTKKGDNSKIVLNSWPQMSPYFHLNAYKCFPPNQLGF